MALKRVIISFLFLFYLCYLVSGEFSLSFQFHRYSNPSRLDATGSCCDTGVFYCPSCETMFQSLCIRSGNILLGMVGQCITGTIYNPGNVGGDTIEFGAYIGSLRNPFEFIGTRIAQSGYQLYLEVYDEDSVTNHDLLDRIVIMIPSQPSSVQSGAYIGIFGRASLVLSYTLSCDQHYYGTDCSVYCLPHNDAVNGHYTCDPSTGAIICRPDWQNTANNCRDVACTLVCQSPGGYCTSNGVCQCNNGWSGDQCVIPQCTEECHPQGGYCNIPNTCLCRTNWEGTLCNESLCDTNCSSIGGECREPTVCTCLIGYTGEACEIDFLPCENQMPCENGGNCSHTDDIGNYYCTCLTGFTGTNCEIDIDECSITSEPCFNNGTCLNGDPGSFKCICTTGWTGERCNSTIDYCETNPCDNNGTCSNLATGYYCTCSPQFEGLNCEVMVNACLPNPCQNNGTCTNLITNYTCTCTEGYTGQNCATNTHISVTTVVTTVATTMVTTTTTNEPSQVGASTIIGAAAGGGGFILVTIITIIVVTILVLCLVMREKKSVKGKDSCSLVNDNNNSTKVIVSGDAYTEVVYDVPDEDLLKTVTNAVYGESINDRYTYSKLNRTSPKTSTRATHKEQSKNEEGKQPLYINDSQAFPTEDNSVPNPVYGGNETEHSSVPNPMYGTNTLEPREYTANDNNNNDSLQRSTLEKGEEGMYCNPLYGGKTSKQDDIELTYDSIPDSSTLS